MVSASFSLSLGLVSIVGSELSLLSFSLIGLLLSSWSSSATSRRDDLALLIIAPEREETPDVGRSELLSELALPGLWSSSAAESLGSTILCSPASCFAVHLDLLTANIFVQGL